MNFESIAAICFVVFLAIFLLIKKKNVEVQKILFPLVYIVMYRTKLGLKLMDKMSARFEKLLKNIGYFAVGVGFLGMFFIAYNLITNVYSIFTKPEAMPGVGLVLPFEVKGAFYVPFFYWIASIFVIAAVHEFSHGVIARAWGMKIKSSGLAFLGIVAPVVPLAFVEPDEEEVKKRASKEQLSMFAAGPFSNIMLAALVLVFSIFVIAPLVNPMIEFDGVKITGFMGGNLTLPAEKSGMRGDEVVKGIDRVVVTNLFNFSSFLDSKKPGETVLLKTDKGEYNVTLAAHPENRSQSYLGVYVAQSSKIKGSITKKIGKIIPNIILWLVGLLYWLFLLNLGIGLFNLVPIGPIDGGRMMNAVLHKYLDKKTAVKLNNFISLFFLILIFINIGFSFIR